MVGLTQEQIKKLPENIFGINRTDSVVELAQLYAIADVFVNPTYEDNYPTTNLEAISCGTPVITYKTGGSPESAEMYGEIVELKNVKKIIQLIKNISKIRYKRININYKITVNQYIELY